MTRAYDEVYVSRAQTAMGAMFRYAEEDVGYTPDTFAEMFVHSGVADLFGSGDFRFLVGMSGIEIAREVLLRTSGQYTLTEPSFHMEKSATYWAGWAIAYYQWDTARSFRAIFEVLPMEEIREMYSPYHEMDLRKFVEEADRRILERRRGTRLKQYRKKLGLSQSELAAASGTSVRMIQYYEQRRKDIDKAQADTVCRLARALHCRAEDLMEG